MKNLYSTFTLMLLALTVIHKLDAEDCNSKTIYLNSHLTYILTREDVLAEPLGPEYEVLFNPQVLTCEHTGDAKVSVTIKLNGNVVTTCFAEFHVLETQQPVAECKSTVHVQLNKYGDYLLKPSDVDNGSYDNCSDLSYYFVPGGVSCSSPNPSTIWMNVRDKSGNERSCSVTVYWEDPEPAPPLACQGDVYIVFYHNNGEELIDVEMIINDPDVDCKENYDLEIIENGIPRPQPVVTINDTNAVLQASVVNTYTDESCLVDLHIHVCDPATIVSFCDTLCRTAPLGDCGSGHTLEDGVEWPCDIFLPNFCYDTSISVYPSPEILRSQYQVDPRDAKPQFPSQGCYLNAILYEDHVKNTFPNPTIIRTWSAINWLTVEIVEYQQTIYLAFDTMQICDTQAWDTPEGNCESGHTLSDDVEWPADITVHTTFISPDDFEDNPAVLIQNARPQLETNCNQASMRYTDLVTEINDTTAVITRTWTIFDWHTIREWTYVQHITVIGDHKASLVCVNLEPGQAIPDVQLIAGVETDASGCYTFENPNSIIVTPQKSAALQEGVNLLDLILLDKMLLGIAPLSEYQTYSADLNRDDTITTIDAVDMKKLINGTLTNTYPGHWKFFEQHTKEPSADISDPLPSHRFIGAKLGDVNNSVLEGIIDYTDANLHITDHQIYGGETYHIPVYLDIDATIEGLGVRFISNNPSLEFLAVTPSQLAGITSQDYFISENALTLLWTSPGQSITGGIAISSSTPLFYILVRAQERIILSEVVSLENNFQHLAKGLPDDEVFDLTLEWDGIINTTIDLNDGRQLSINPNPTTDIIYINGLLPDDAGSIKVMNSLGVTVSTFDLHDHITLAQLPEGLYYLIVKMNTGIEGVIPVVKIEKR